MVTIPCPHCQKAESVIKHSATKAGTPRCFCKDCKRAFCINPKPRTLTSEKQALILRHLEERTAIRGICRALRCSPNTVYAVLKKDPDAARL